MGNQSSPSVIKELEHQKTLLQLEYEHEKEEFCKQTEAMGIARKVKRGICWYPVRLGRSYYNSLNQLVVEVTRTEDLEVNHSFEFGRPVRFFSQQYNGTISYLDFTATVSYADDTRMVVSLPSTQALASLEGKDSLGVQLFFDETSYKTMFEALADVINASDNRLAELRETLLGKQPIQPRELFPMRSLG